MEIPLESGKIRHQAAEVNSDGKLYILHYSREAQKREKWGLDTRVN